MILPPPVAHEAPPVVKWPRRPVLAAAALVASLVAVMLAGAAVWLAANRPPPPPAPKPAAPSYSQEQVDVAKARACQAWRDAGLTLDAARAPYEASPTDAALTRLEAELAIQTTWVRRHLTGATPPDLARFINDYLDATIDVVAADARAAATEANLAANRMAEASMNIKTHCDAR